MEYETLDGAILAVLPENSQVLSVVQHGSTNWSTGLRVDVLEGDEEKGYFVKIIERGELVGMAEAEYEGQNAIANVIPNNAVKPVAWGYFAETKSKAWFMAEYCNLRARAPPLEQFLPIVQQMHQKSVSPTGKFGFHVTPFYGPPPMSVDWTDNWEKFWVREFRSGLKYVESMRGHDTELLEIAENFIAKVAARLLRPLQTGGRNIKPSLCHGDLWDGNIQFNVDTQQPVIFDPCSFFGHHEMDFQCMKSPRYVIGQNFIDLYKEKIGASEPSDDFEDRVSLYAVRNDLMVAGMWPQWASLVDKAKDEMKRLLEKYPDGLESFKGSLEPTVPTMDEYLPTESTAVCDSESGDSAIDVSSAANEVQADAEKKPCDSYTSADLPITPVTPTSNGNSTTLHDSAATARPRTPSAASPCNDESSARLANEKIMSALTPPHSPTSVTEGQEAPSRDPDGPAQPEAEALPVFSPDTVQNSKIADQTVDSTEALPTLAPVTAQNANITEKTVESTEALPNLSPDAAQSAKTAEKTADPSEALPALSPVSSQGANTAEKTADLSEALPTLSPISAQSTNVADKTVESAEALPILSADVVQSASIPEKTVESTETYSQDDAIATKADEDDGSRIDTPVTATQSTSLAQDSVAPSTEETGSETPKKSDIDISTSIIPKKESPTATHSEPEQGNVIAAEADNTGVDVDTAETAVNPPVAPDHSEAAARLILSKRAKLAFRVARYKGLGLRPSRMKRLNKTIHRKSAEAPATDAEP